MAWRNRAKCRNCGDIIESKHGHDFVTCKCHVEWNNKHHELLEEFITETEKYTMCGKEYELNHYDYDSFYADPRRVELQKNMHGFSLDGGKGYGSEHLGTRCLGNFDDIIWMTGEDDDGIQETIDQVRSTY